VVDAQQVTHPNMKAVNTKAEPNNVAPSPIKHVSIDGRTLRAKLVPGSWNVIVTAAA
jgi:alpha-N-arabinofuranosidase